MLNRQLPYFLEDRSGIFTATDYDDIYDRLFLRVAPAPSHSPTPFALTIHNTGRRSSPTHTPDFRHSRDLSSPREPALVLEFGPRGALGNVLFAGAKTESVPMAQWLRKTSLFAGSVRASSCPRTTLTTPSTQLALAQVQSDRRRRVPLGVPGRRGT